MRYNILQEKSFQFSLNIIECYKELRFKKKEYVISNQLLRSGTSIGANIEESIGAQSDRDFLNKISISYKEARETKYWLKLLKSSYEVSKIDDLIDLSEELLRIIGAVQIKMKQKILNNPNTKPRN